MGAWNAGADIFTFGAVTKNTSEETAIMNCRGAENFNFAFKMESAGSPDVTLTFYYWLVPDGQSAVAGTYDLRPNQTDTANSFTAANELSVVLKANETTKGSWVHYTPPSDLQYPFACYWVKLTENNGAALTDAILIVNRNKV